MDLNSNEGQDKSNDIQGDRTIFVNPDTEKLKVFLQTLRDEALPFGQDAAGFVAFVKTKYNVQIQAEWKEGAGQLHPIILYEDVARYLQG